MFVIIALRNFQGPLPILALILEAQQLNAEVALDGYGRSFSPEALKVCIEARTFVALVWLIVLHRQHPSQKRQSRIEGRLHWFRKREGIAK